MSLVTGVQDTVECKDAIGDGVSEGFISMHGMMVFNGVTVPNVVDINPK